MPNSTPQRVLSFDVRTRRFGFAILEGPHELLDWGIRSFRRGVNAVRIPPCRKIESLMSEFRPDVIVIERSPLRGNSWLVRTIRRLAVKQHILLRVVSRADIRNHFADEGQDKHGIATALCIRFPVLAERLPPKRKAWQSEDYRLSIFDATALGLAYVESSA